MNIALNCCQDSPYGRPSILTKILLVIRVQQLDGARGHAAEAIVVNAQVVHAPLRQVVGIVELKIQFNQCIIMQLLMKPSN